MSAYSEASKAVFQVFRETTPLVEGLSIDEAFLDVHGSEPLFGDAVAIARQIKGAVRDEQGLTASVGVATTKLVAKVASDLRKPDGLVVVPAGEEATFLAPLSIERLWGVGAATRRALADYDVRTIGDLAALPADVLTRRFGKNGVALAERARGIDPSPVSDPADAKSVSHEHTFDSDTNHPEVIESSLLSLAEGVAARLRDSGLRAATVGVKIRDSDFATITRQRTIDPPTDLGEEIFAICVALARPEVRGIHVRLLGVFASNLGRPEQLALFSAEDRRRRAVAAADEIRHRFGSAALRRARLVGSEIPEPFERDALSSPEAPQVGRPREGSGS
jgi:DNA polymerase-4